MKNNKNIFNQLPHNQNIDEIFHQLRIDNIANIFFWMDLINKIKNDINLFDSVVECGVGRGRSLISLISILTIIKYDFLIKNDQTSKTDFAISLLNNFNIYGLDSFEGFPEPSKNDKSEFRNPKRGEWSCSPSKKYLYTPEFLRDVLKNAGVDFKNVNLIKGFFSDSCPELAKKNPKIGILHCDGDLYESVKDPLIYLPKYLVKGGIIVFDDFILDEDIKNDFFPGSRIAFEEFHSKNKDKYHLIKNSRGCAVLQKK